MLFDASNAMPLIELNLASDPIPSLSPVETLLPTTNDTIRVDILILSTSLALPTYKLLPVESNAIEAGLDIPTNVEIP